LRASLFKGEKMNGYRVLKPFRNVNGQYLAPPKDVLFEDNAERLLRLKKNGIIGNRISMEMADRKFQNTPEVDNIFLEDAEEIMHETPEAVEEITITTRKRGRRSRQ
jgi:hypothetical protein